MKLDKVLLLIIFLAILFRFFRLFDFQYWSVDEEVFVAVVAQIAILHKLILVTPNVAIATSLGSFFHLLSAPIFWLAGFTASRILIAGSILGVVTTLAIYKTGKELGDLSVGRIAAFLYAASFLAAFSDRRWWPLSLDPLLSVLSILSVIKMIKGRLHYSLLLAICASFAWHSDPSLSVIIVFAVLSFVLFRLPLFKKVYFLGAVYLFLSILPFLFFEIRHPGAITHPLVELLSHLFRFTRPSNRSLNLLSILQGFSRALFLKPGADIEQYFLYVKHHPAPLFSPFAEISTLLFFFLPLSKLDQTGIKLLYLYLLSFLVGILIFTLGLGSSFHQHYFVIAWPAFFLLMAFSLRRLSKSWAVIILSAFLTINLGSLFWSSMRYPLIKKERMVDRVLAQISKKRFALEVTGGDRYFEGIGGLFFLKNRYPANSHYYYAWDWIYRAYSLYPVEISPGPFDTTVVISPHSLKINENNSVP